MKIQTILIIITILISHTLAQQSTITCHYSCKQCVGTHYTLCTKCIQDRNITIVQDPTISQQQYINSNQKSGICISDQISKVNALGVLLIIICTAIVAVVRTSSSIYLFSTLQTVSLISFVEIAWIDPVGYLLQALQYFMIFNWWGSGYKVQDQTLRQRQYYRLDLYFHQSGFLRNFAIIGFFDGVLFVGIVVLAIWKYRKDKKQFQQKLQQQQQQQQQHDQKLQIQLSQSQIPHESQKKQQPILHKILQSTLKILLTLFFLLIQQTSLVIVTSLRFQRPLSTAAKALPIIYCIILLLFLTYIFFYPLWFFPNKQTQYISIWRKIGLPVLCIVPYTITYLIVVFMLIFVILQSFFDYRGGKLKLLSRITFFKILQLITVILAGAYILTELNRNLQGQTNIIRVIFAIGIVLFFVCFVVQAVFGVYQTYFSKNVQVANQSNLDQRQRQSNMNNNNNKNNKEGRHYLDQQHTLQAIDVDNKNDIKDNIKNNQIKIYDMQNVFDDHGDHGDHADHGDRQQHNNNNNRLKNSNDLKIIKTSYSDNLGNNKDKDKNDNQQQNKDNNANNNNNTKSIQVVDLQQSQKQKQITRSITQQTDTHKINVGKVDKPDKADKGGDQLKSQDQDNTNINKIKKKKKKDDQDDQQQERKRKRREYIAKMDPAVRKAYGYK